MLSTSPPTPRHQELASWGSQGACPACPFTETHAHTPEHKFTFLLSISFSFLPVQFLSPSHALLLHCLPACHALSFPLPSLFLSSPCLSLSFSISLKLYLSGSLSFLFSLSLSFFSLSVPLCFFLISSTLPPGEPPSTVLPLPPRHVYMCEHMYTCTNFLFYTVFFYCSFSMFR